jgi:hypothetical protein
MNRPYRRYVLALCASILISCSATAQTQPTKRASEPVLTVSGEVSLPLKLSPAELAKLPRSIVKAKGHDGKEASFEGIALIEILKLAGVEFGEHLRGKSLANYLLVEAADGYRAVFALPELDPAFNDRTIILADHRDGSPLTAKDGPWQIVVPGEKRQARWVRQVLSLTIRSSEIGSPTKDSPTKVKE